MLPIPLRKQATFDAINKTCINVAPFEINHAVMKVHWRFMHSHFPSFPSKGSFLKWMPCMSVCASPPALTAHTTLSARLGPPPSAPHRSAASTDSTAATSQAGQWAVTLCIATPSWVRVRGRWGGYGASVGSATVLIVEQYAQLRVIISILPSTTGDVCRRPACHGDGTRGVTWYR